MGFPIVTNGLVQVGDTGVDGHAVEFAPRGRVGEIGGGLDDQRFPLSMPPGMGVQPAQALQAEQGAGPLPAVPADGQRVPQITLFLAQQDDGDLLVTLAVLLVQEFTPARDVEPDSNRLR